MQTTDPSTEPKQVNTVANRLQIREILKDSLIMKVEKWFNVGLVPLLKVSYRPNIFQVVAYHNRLILT